MKTNSQASVKSPCPGQQSCALVSENEFSELEKEKWLRWRGREQITKDTVLAPEINNLRCFE